MEKWEEGGRREKGENEENGGKEMGWRRMEENEEKMGKEGKNQVEKMKKVE